MSVIHQIKLGVGSCGFINDYSILLSQHLEDLCPGMDKPVIQEERFVNNLEMDGGLKASSSSFHPGQEAPGSTLEEGHSTPAWTLSNDPRAHVNGRQLKCVSVAWILVSESQIQYKSTEK